MVPTGTTANGYTVPIGTTQADSVMKRRTPAPDCLSPEQPETIRARILAAAFEAVRERGYAATSTREIVARAKVSKRELYTEFGNKDGIFAALIANRADRMRRPTVHDVPKSRTELASLLTNVGAAFLELLGDPVVIAMFRLAISAAEDAPELARLLDKHGRQPNRHALTELMTEAANAKLIAGEPAALAARFFALVIEDLHTPMLLGLVASLSPRERERRAADATTAFLQLHAAPPPTPARATRSRT
jgi:AcrR family transcriptional regulator